MSFQNLKKATSYSLVLLQCNQRVKGKCDLLVKYFPSRRRGRALQLLAEGILKRGLFKPNILA